MTYELKNTRNGEPAPYKTTVDITEKDGVLTFAFVAEHSDCYCPFHNYNDIHSMGDACEVLIGSDPERRHYYEIEISPENALMCGRIEYKGPDERGIPKLGLDLVEECFLTGSVTRTATGYTATVSFPKEKILSGEGEIYFNAYRLETDGGEMNKHLFALNPTMIPWFHRPAYFVWLKDYVK